jgi:hypothetical protein
MLRFRALWLYIGAIMAQANKVCPHCKKVGHSGFYCPVKPKKPIKQTAIKHKPITRAEQNRLSKLAKVRKPRKKSSPRKIAKDKAWDAFSLFIRTRDCIRFTGDPEQGICVTCNTPKLRKELQAGHFVGGRGNAVLFNEQIVYSQCGYCNQKPPMGLGGNYAAYTLFMFDEGYSREEIEAFLALKNSTKQYKINDFIEIRATYEQKTKGLLARVQTY